nr:MAG TPA: hypothetical protein [Caudoviricetes sp.]
MNCNCRNTIVVSSATTTSTGVVLIPNRPITQTNLTNLGRYYLIIACGVKATASLPVYIQTSAGNIPVLCKFGNQVYSNQVRKRYRYSIGYGDENTSYTLGQFVIFNSLDCACPTNGSVVTTSAEKAVK